MTTPLTELKLERLVLDYQTYGTFKGQYTGSATFSGYAGRMELYLSPDVSDAILAVVADELVKSSKLVAQNLTAHIITQVAEAKAAERLAAPPEEESDE